MSDSSIRVKKVKAYPFPVIIKNDAGLALQGQVVKLTLTGLMAEVNSPSSKVGDKFEVHFELPAIHHVVHEQAVIMKIYNQFGGGVAVQLMEIHFRTLDSLSREKITHFVRLSAKP